MTLNKINKFLSNKYLMPILIIILVLIVKNMKNTKPENEIQEGFNVQPTTIDYKTLNISQKDGTAGEALLLGQIPQEKRGYSIYFDVLPSPNFNGRMQFGLSVPENAGTKEMRCFHELVFGVPMFSQMKVTLENGIFSIFLIKTDVKNEKYYSPIPVILSCSGSISTSDLLKSNEFNNQGTSLLSGVGVSGEEKVVSTQNTEKYSALIKQTLEDNGITVNNNEVKMNKLTVNHLHSNGQIHANDLVDCKGVKFDREREHINTDGALYRHGGQVYLTTDDNIHLRKHNNGNEWIITGNDNLIFKNKSSSTDNFAIGKNGGLHVKTFNGAHGQHLNGVLNWHK